ncbi:MAG: roadblock/LC7 domain-containing protein [Acidimicrobiia bacterium]|nr:roadblock/LC7 domain-containing protein [Acidimicrobiia bacterium]
MTSTRTDLGFLLDHLASQVPGIREAAVVSSDGLPIAASQGVDPADVDRLAAVAAALLSIARGAGQPIDGGPVQQLIVEMERALLVVMGISDGSTLAVIAQQPCDLGLIAYEMATFVERAGAALSPALVADLRTPAAS